VCDADFTGALTQINSFGDWFTAAPLASELIFDTHPVGRWTMLSILCQKYHHIDFVSMGS